MSIKKGDYVETPRFLKVRIAKVFRKLERARAEGFIEPTHYRDSDYYIRGKHTGPNRMIFAAIKR